MRAHGMQARIAYPVSSMPAMIDVVAKGLACAVLPASAVTREVEDGRLVTRRIIDPSLTRTLSIAQSAGLVATPELVQLGDSCCRRCAGSASRTPASRFMTVCGPAGKSAPAADFCVSTAEIFNAKSCAELLSAAQDLSSRCRSAPEND
jgi:hypothetical protein